MDGLALAAVLAILLLCVLAGHIIIEAVDAAVYLGEIIARNIKRRKDKTRFYAQRP